jgi:hypothetical protein
MDTKKILSWVSLLLGETLIIAAFILFRGNMEDNILILNIMVATIIYSLMFIDILIPWIDFGDNSQRRIGSIGVRWLVTWLYSFSAIAVMVICNRLFAYTFTTQLLIHGALIFLLLLGFIAAIHSSDKIKEVFVQENNNRSGIIEMKKAISNLKDKMNSFSDLPEYLTNRINTLEDNIRFISPSNNQEAYELERSFSNTINEIAYAISNLSMNEEAVESNLRKCERIYQNRKQIHSN